MTDDELSTRATILTALRRQTATVTELAELAGITANGVRALLVALERDGLVRRAGFRRADGVGKPPALYVATAEANEQSSTAYAPALAALAGTLADHHAGEELRGLFADAGRRVAMQLPQPADADPGDAAAALLTLLGAVVSVDHSAPEKVINGTACPLSRAVKECRDSCELVRALLAYGVGMPVRIACDYSGEPRCRFVVG